MKIGKRYLIVLLGAFTALYFNCGAAHGASSPLGTWDFTVSGGKSGSASLTFHRDYSIVGYILVIPKSYKNEGTILTANFGFAKVKGQWQPDGKNIVGYLYNDPSETVRLDFPSLKGAVSAGGNSFVFNAQNEDGNVKFSGVPMPAAPHETMPINWTINLTTQGIVMYTEFLTALPDENNLYTLTGVGANYCVYGYANLSRGKNLGVALWEFPMTDTSCPAWSSTPDNSAVLGGVALGSITINPDSQSGSTTLKGVQQGSPGPKVTMKVLCQ